MRGGMAVSREEEAQYYAVAERKALDRAEAAEREAGELRERNETLTEALAFYAHPYTYTAIGFFPDPPCGEFMGDFDEDYEAWLNPGDPGFDREMPGKRARAVLVGREGA